MKKTIFAILALAAVAACNKAEVIESNPGEAIEFGDAFVDNATKATDPSYSANNITEFNVYGTVNNVVIYPGTKVTKGGAAYNTAWTCPVDQYWIPGASYKFVGIVDGNKEDVTKTNLTNGMPVSIEYTADGQTDLLCHTITKTANTDGTANGLVAFNFTHLLSKVNFTVTNNSTEANGYSFVVKNIVFAGRTNAEYNVEGKAWENPVTGNISFPDVTVETTVASNDLETEMLLIPGTVNVSFTVDILYNGTPITSTDYAPTTTYNIEAGNAYNFKVAVSVGELIQFTVEKQPTWTPTTGATDVTL